MTPPYKQSLSQLYSYFTTDPIKGLTANQVEKLLLEHGKNNLPFEKPPSILYLFLMQCADPLVYLLLTAAAIIFFVGKPLDACIISGILLFNAIVGTIQEKRTESMLQTLQHLLTHESKVTRDGIQQIIHSDMIVPGDIVHVTSGEKVPADAKIISSTNLLLNESILTGESTPVEKNHHEQNTKENLIFSGTYILSGTATALVFATGKDTKLGKIHSSIEYIDTTTPLKKELEQLAHWILYGVFMLCGCLFVIGIATGKPLVDVLVMLTALFICIVPEGLPVVITVILISTAYKMSQKNMLVKHLRAIETLGRVNVIITDKTGTLTRNEMMVSSVFIDGTALSVSGSGYAVQGSVEKYQAHEQSLNAMAQACILLNDTIINYNQTTKTFLIQGDPTQAAAFVFAQKIMSVQSTTIQANYTIPFDSAYRYKAAFYNQGGKTKAAVIGSPEAIFAACTSIEQTIKNQLEQYLASGYRVIAVAEKIYEEKNNLQFADYQSIVSSGLHCIGLLAIADEPREHISNVIKQLNKAGIRVIMATGDHPQTAEFVARKVGIGQNNDITVTGDMFENMDDTQALQALSDSCVFARFSPQDKVRLVNLLHQQGKFVATTGDGVNDVPALAASDVSIAMGNIGTELTKQASDIILLDDAFENIVYAIEQGRSIVYALRRTILYFLTSNAGEVFIVFFALIASLPLPLLPAQILWLNLITDGFLDMALAMEPAHSKNVQNNAKKNITIFDRSIIGKMVYLALPMSLIGLATFINWYQIDLAFARTLTLVTLVMFQWFNALNCRSETKSVFTIGLFSNKWLVIATVTIFVLQALVVYLPFLQLLFTTVPLSAVDWLYAIAAASTIFIVEEFRKYAAVKFFAS